MSLKSSHSTALGIVGGGQLGKMLAIAASSLGIKSLFLDPSGEAVAQHVAHQICAPYDETTAIRQLFDGSFAVTFEFENVSVAALKQFGDLNKLAPSLTSLHIANDRIREKEFFQECGLEVAPFVGLTEVDTLSDEQFFAQISTAAESLGYPVIVKTCALGYDGKGQVRLTDASTIHQTLSLKLAKRLVVEKRVAFNREVSVIAVRSRDGNIQVYPCPENVHRDGILYSSLILESAPIPELDSAIRIILAKLDYVGVLAVEFFEVAGKFLVNEMAPRVHNTGHWSIEGAITSQFENHVRAVMGLPLGDCSLRFPTAMINIIGANPKVDQILNLPGVHLHLYGKEPRAGRKLGHITIEAASAEQLRERMQAVERCL